VLGHSCEVLLITDDVTPASLSVCLSVCLIRYRQPVCLIKEPVKGIIIIIIIIIIMICFRYIIVNTLHKSDDDNGDDDDNNNGLFQVYNLSILHKSDDNYDNNNNNDVLFQVYNRKYPA